MQNTSESEHNRLLTVIGLNLLSVILALVLGFHSYIGDTIWNSLHCWTAATKENQNNSPALPSECTSDASLLVILLLILFGLNLSGMFKARGFSARTCYIIMVFNLFLLGPIIPAAFSSPTINNSHIETGIGLILLLAFFANFVGLGLKLRDRLRAAPAKNVSVHIEPAPNPWLVSYISSQQSKSSRYDIDLYLLKQGYPAAEIEAAWEALARQ